MRCAAVGIAVLGLLVGGASAAHAQEQVAVAPAGSPAEFPQRSYRLAVPARRGLLPQDLEVTENGEPVNRLALASAGGARPGAFGAILVIDASASMHGAAIRSATEAARELARQRTGAQQIGIVVFNRTPRVLLAPTADQAAIDAALSQPPQLGPQTHIFDAVGTALNLLRAAKITAGSIVVLSDGSDTGSATAPAAIARRARSANVAIYTVGLRSRAFDSAELKGLAESGRGRYAAAASRSDLRHIFRELGTELASDYLVSYRSFANPGSEVTVAVRVDGVDGLATSSYTVPGGASFVQIRHSFWTSAWGVTATGLSCALLLALALAILLARRRRGPSLRARVGSFVSTPGDRALDADAVLTQRPASSAERSLERTKWWSAFKLDVELARVTMTPMRILAVTAIATLMTMLLALIVTGLALVALFALAIPWGVRAWLRIKRERQRALFTDQLPDVLQGAASAVRAGHGLVAALTMIAEDAPEPSREEFRRVVADEALGVPLEEALRLVQRRMNSREVLQIALVAQVQRDAGGNMAEVLDRITETLRQHGELRRMVTALTAQGRLSRWVVTALPVALLVVLAVANPHYIEPLFNTPLGVAMLVGAGFMMLIGSMVIGKIVDFKV